jgi:hypothetical protein
MAMRWCRPRSVQRALIGRSVEQARIDEWFSSVTGADSLGRVLVVAGLPGIGKTAVLDAWLQAMDDRIIGVRTRCSPEQILPFEAFAPLLATGADRAPHGLRTQDQLFARVVHRLQAMDDGRPIVLAIDDAQWLTPSSVALLRHLVHDHRLDRLRVVMTLRQHEVPDNPALQQLLIDWLDRLAVQTHVLGPLADDDIVQLGARYIRTDAGPSTFGPGDLKSLTGGNPLFVIQMAQAGAVGPTVPATVEHLLGQYLQGLSPGVRRSIEMAAFLGVEGSLAQLARCTGRSELDEIAALDTVAEGRLLDVTALGGRYRFVHELARRTVRSQVPPGRAMRLHLAIADGLELERDPDVFAIAHHLRLAVPVAAASRAAVALLAGARRARELADFQNSAESARQAFELTDDSAVQADALVLMASAAQSMGHRDVAAQSIGRAIELALESNATAVLARAMFVKSAVMCSWGADDLSTRVEAAADAHADSLELVEIVWALCLDRPVYSLPPRQALAERALRIARASGDDEALMQALHANQLVGQMTLSDPEVVLDWGNEAMQLADRLEYQMAASLINAQLLVASLRAGRLDDALLVHARMIEQEPAVPDLAFHWASRARSAALALVTDDLVTAERLVLQARDIGEPLAGTWPAEEYINHMGLLHLARGSLPGLHHLFGAWVDQQPGPVWHWAVGPGELLDPAEPTAIERRETLVANSGNPTPPHSEWLAELTIAAEYAHRSGDHDLGKIVARCIEPFVHHHAVFGVAITLGSMWRPYALALAAAGEHRESRQAMATARLVNAGAGLVLWERLSRSAL